MKIYHDFGELYRFHNKFEPTKKKKKLAPSDVSRCCLDEHTAILLNLIFFLNLSYFSR